MDTLKSTFMDPFKGALVDPFKGALVDPFKEPFKIPLKEPFKGTLERNPRPKPWQAEGELRHLPFHRGPGNLAGDPSFRSH